MCLLTEFSISLVFCWKSSSRFICSALIIFALHKIERLAASHTEVFLNLCFSYSTPNSILLKYVKLVRINIMRESTHSHHTISFRIIPAPFIQSCARNNNEVSNQTLQYLRKSRHKKIEIVSIQRHDLNVCECGCRPQILQIIVGQDHVFPKNPPCREYNSHLSCDSTVDDGEIGRADEFSRAVHASTPGNTF